MIDRELSVKTQLLLLLRNICVIDFDTAVYPRPDPVDAKAFEAVTEV